jgi:uncharacterized protein YyaL (SSP411 family)
MRIIMISIMMLVSLWGSEINWAHSYAEAQERAAKEHKNVLLLITTEYCRWCRKLEAFTLTDERVAERVNREFVAVHVTRDKDDYPEHLTAQRVPTSYFLTPEGEVIHEMMGYWNVEDYLSILDDVKFALTQEKK